MKEKFPKIHLECKEIVEPLIAELTSEEAEICRATLTGNTNTAIVIIGGKKHRAIKASSGTFSVTAISADPDRVKSKSLMQNEACLALAAAPTIKNAVERSNLRTKRLIHNLKSITAKTMQEVFVFAQQHELIGKSAADQSLYIQEEISRNPIEAASAFVEILKHQGAQKAEYSSFETLSGSPGLLKKERHEIHKVLMNVFYLFFGDFFEKKSSAFVTPTRDTAIFDYDSIHASIYYVVENSAKYIERGSKLTVTTEIDQDFALIRFDMNSTFIGLDEEDLIFQENYSGKIATEQKKNGNGIGLYLARQLAHLNGGTLTLLCRRKPGNTLYSSNTFVLALPTK